MQTHYICYDDHTYMTFREDRLRYSSHQLRFEMLHQRAKLKNKDFRKKSTVQLGNDQTAAGLNISCQEFHLSKAFDMKNKNNHLGGYNHWEWVKSGDLLSIANCNKSYLTKLSRSRLQEEFEDQLGRKCLTAHKKLCLIIISLSRGCPNGISNHEGDPGNQKIPKG
jgi:hypothetical protein